MPSILITGCRRGIGLELSQQFAELGWRVYACTRSPENSQTLLQLAADHPQVSCHLLDVGKPMQLAALSAELRGQPIDVLLNNAGVYGAGPQSLDDIDAEDFLETLRINTVAPLQVVRAFLDNVKASERKVIACISSKMGSMADNTSGGSYVYRASKAALNSVVKSLAMDLEEQQITAVALHPGWVRTDMGGPQGELSVEESAALLIKNLCELSLKQNGRFIDIDGVTIPW